MTRPYGVGFSRRTLLSLVVTAIALMASQVSAPVAHAGPLSCRSSVPYRSGDGGYHTFRVPAALQVPGGALLAFAEGRRNSAADDGDIDLVLRRSLDRGCTWQPLQVVADAGRDTVGNPVPVIDPRSGDVVLVTCRTIGPATERQVRNGAVPGSVRRVYVQRSTDGGMTWSEQRDITGSVKTPEWRWYAVGPGHAVALRRGPHRGRLLVPANHSLSGSGKIGAHSIYSDDGGLTWRVGYVTDASAGPLELNESTLAELPDGRVYINTREHSSRPRGSRADAYSSDGGATLSVPFRAQPQLTGPVVQGSVMWVPGPSLTGRLLYSGPADETRRIRMQVRASDDGGESWRPLWTASEDPAGYSDLVRIRAGVTGLLYETGSPSYHETIRFALLPPPFTGSL
ncbi:sialidase family protein [Streptomyces sp. NPDC006923]|uniref:sialidase family protein n=1 Tax=Streptomyces sp. NPDC006923 TaxID=3155355 RepID=UPI0033E370DE